MHKKIECSYSQQQKVYQMFVNIWKIKVLKYYEKGSGFMLEQ